MSTIHMPLPENASPELDSLRAPRGAQRVSARVISETVFCPRAGLIAHELSQEPGKDDGEEWDGARRPRLDFLPDYNEQLIYESLRQKWDEVYWVISLAIWWTLISFVVLFAVNFALGVFLAAPLPVVFHWLFRQVGPILELGRRWRAYVRAKHALKISDLGKEEQIVNWWQLRKAGFAVIKPQEPNLDHDAQLIGKPYLILMHQSLRIPVFRKHRGTPEVHSQNRARIAAYCHLLESQERARSPFGVMLFAGTYDAVIIPYNRRSWSVFRDGLNQARDIIAAAQSGELPAAPAPRQCSRCHLAFPRRDDGERLVRFGAYTPHRDSNGHDYHSDCGDRFEWLPPHELAIERRLH